MGRGASQGPHAKRIDRLRSRLISEGLRGIILAPGPNLAYYTGVSSQLLERPFLMFVPADGEVQLVAPRLESGPYKNPALKIEIHEWDDSEGPHGAFASVGRAVELQGRWGCEGRVPFAFFGRLAGVAGLRLVPGEALLQAVREMKERAELRELAKAAKILCKAYRSIPEMVRAGMTELELSRALRKEIFSRGGDAVEFCMVQSGPNAANPHSASSGRKIQRNDGFVVDAGCTLSGYNADVTRSFLLGENRSFEEVYAAVVEAQRHAIDAVSEGTTVGAVDRAARRHLEKKGLGRYFIHRTGHGLGLEVHEAPYIVPGGRERLRAGMVFTIEPGAYIPGKLGVRMEDDVAIADGGARILTDDLPREYSWWS